MWTELVNVCLENLLAKILKWAIFALIFAGALGGSIVYLIMK